MHRRQFLSRSTALGGAALLAVPSAVAQQAPPTAGQQSGSSNLFEMNQGAAKRVVLAPKPGATASMTEDERDSLEHDIRCQCGCTLDVYICRTTDFSCQVSPAMHRDILALVAGGHSAQEILDAFVTTYGERALMAPKREGFNWAGYLMPFAALGAGGAGLLYVLRGMRRRAALAAVAPSGAVGGRGTDDEMARLDAAVRRDD